MKTSKRIKLVLITADSGFGGGTSHILGILRNINLEKFETYLVCPKGYLSNEARNIQGIKIFHVRMNSKFDFGSVFDIKSVLAKIQSSGDPFGPMIAHSHGPRALFLSSFATPDPIKRIYSEHIYNDDYHLKNPLNGWLQKSLLKHFWKRTNLVIAVSHSVKNFLTKNRLCDEKKITLIPNGIDLSIQTSAAKRKIKELNLTPIIGTIGSLNEQKGQKYLIESLPIVLKKYPLASMEIIGSGEMLKSLKSLTKSLKVERHVSFLGQQKNIGKYMKNWDVFVLPSISETFGIVALEAMAAGIPLVATRTGGITDIVSSKSSGLIVETKNSQAIAKAVIDIVNKPALAAQLKRGGLERVSAFDWKKVIVKLENAYEAVADVAPENV